MRMGSPPARRTFRAFTLIELLVVISIIAILSSILFPVFAKARERANQTSCISNEKQIGIALLSYLQDNDDLFPMNRFLNTAEPNGKYRNWMDAVFPLIRSKDVMKCPSNDAGKRYPALSEESGLYPISYALNGSLFDEYAYVDATTQRQGYTPVRLSQIKDPSGAILLTETRAALPDLAVDAVTFQSNDKGAFNQHMGRVNFLFVDGHARALKLSETLTPSQMWYDGRYTQPDYMAMAPNIPAEYR